MAIDPLKRVLNRADQIKTEKQFQKGIRIYDVDQAIADHMIDTVLPTLEVKNEVIKIPVLYGNPERWKTIQKDGVLRDSRGSLQVPLVMFKRNSIDRDGDMPNMMNRQLTYPAVSKYSKKHKYDLFSLMQGTIRPLEQYNIKIPDYVTVTYEVMVWTDFTEHMNTILEAFQYATDEYWGDKNGYKFKTQIDSFDNVVDISDNSERIVRSTFTMLVKAYLLPERFNNEPTTTKAFGVKKVIFNTEKIIGEDGIVIQSNITAGDIAPIVADPIVPAPTIIIDGGSAITTVTSTTDGGNATTSVTSITDGGSAVVA